MIANKIHRPVVKLYLSFTALYMTMKLHHDVTIMTTIIIITPY